jgi:adenine-specific DNA-methyltransferase
VNLSFPGKVIARQLGRRVRPRNQRTVKTLSAGDEHGRSRNLLIEGDNLQALASLYRERGQIDMILTDPPYNTGGDFRYNDKWDKDPNDPDMGEFVGSDDPAKHTKWMKFMYPRLQMMRAMLKASGVLAICIDSRELFHLGRMLDELFGEENRLAIINWQKTAAPRSDKGGVTTTTEYVLVYAKSLARAKTASMERTDADNRRYGNPDGDSRGLWREGNLTARTWAESGDFAIQSPFTGEMHYPAGEGAWRHPKRNVKEWLEQWGSAYREKDIRDGKVKALVLKTGSTQTPLRGRRSDSKSPSGLSSGSGATGRGVRGPRPTWRSSRRARSRSPTGPTRSWTSLKSSARLPGTSRNRGEAATDRASSRRSSARGTGSRP